MAIQKDIPCIASNVSRIHKDGTSKAGVGNDNHVLVGSVGAGDKQMEHRSLLRFSVATTAAAYGGVKQVLKAEIVLRVFKDPTQHWTTTGGKVAIYRAAETWTEGTHNEDDWDIADFRRPPQGKTLISTSSHPNQDRLEVFLDVTTGIGAHLPPSVLGPSGAAGTVGTKAGQNPNNGFILRASNENDNAQRMAYFSRHAGSYHPVLRITYEPTNTKPTAPTLTAPNATRADAGDSFKGTHNDPDRDPLAEYEIIVKKGTVVAWTYVAVATADETSSGQFSVPLSEALSLGSLSLQTAYTWTAATKDARGLWGPHSAARNLLIGSANAPVVTASSPGSIPRMSGVKFGGAYSDADGDPLALSHVQLRARVLPTDPVWNTALPLWDTGESVPTTEEVTAKKIEVEYGGNSLAAGDYSFRVRGKDDSGLWSAWSYADFTLTQPYEVDPSPLTDLITQPDRDAPVRIALYKMDSTNTTVRKRRGPGTLIGHLEDPVNLGGSKYLNGAGELYFTLPADHPYCPEIEPHKVHYVVEQWWGDRFRSIFEGLITDFDATPDEVVFYGTDYLGLYQTRVDERFNPKKKDEVAPTGSKYVQTTLSGIIRDQLIYHRDRPNSPVGFIDVPAIGTNFNAFPESATIYSTYTEALPFMIGLIDSHKQGTGKEARLHVVKASSGAYEVRLNDNWGKDRKNIRFEYGGLLNDFRVVALGDFGTSILGVGQKRGEVTVYRATGDSGLDEAVWGRIGKARFWPDVNDENDLKRRAKEAAMQMAKIGKRIALAIRADGLRPFDGYDVGDHVWVDIDRGVTNTAAYGSGGMWTIYGLEFRYYPDGHHDLTLTVMPKKSSEEAPDDLIKDSKPPVWDPHWQVGHGTPSVLGVPPTGGTTRTGEPVSDETVQAEFYEDLNTGNIYRLDQATEGYDLIYEPPDVPPGPGVDIIPPPVPAFKAIEIAPGPPPVMASVWSELVVQEDGSSVTGLFANVGYEPESPAGLTDLSEIILQSTRYTLPDLSGPDWTRAQNRIVTSEDATGTKDTIVTLVPVVSATTYHVRVAAIDVSGNRSDWSGWATVESAADEKAPPRPANVVLKSGMSTFGMRWDPIAADDFAYTEVQYRRAAFLGAPEVIADPDHDPPIEAAPALPPYDAAPWIALHTAATLIVVAGLENGDPRDPKALDVRLRSVDWSGNTKHDTGTLDPEGGPKYEDVRVSEPASDEKGWVTKDIDGVTLVAKPSALPADSLIWTEAMIEDLFAGEINATWITTGTLRVGNAPPMSDADKEAAEEGPTRIEVYDADGTLVGRWGTEGIEVMDPDHDDYKLIITNAGLTIWNDWTKKDPGTGESLAWPSVRLTPLGIDAGSITFGSMRGGHNLLLNSSFEMGAFAVGVQKTSTWDTNTDWNAAGSRQAEVNVTTDPTLLRMTSVT